MQLLKSYPKRIAFFVAIIFFIKFVKYKKLVYLLHNQVDNINFKIITMKKIAAVITVFVLIAIGIYSCEADLGGDCAFCKELKTLPDGTEVYTGLEEEFCLEELEDIRSELPITDPDGSTTEWICD